MQTIIWLYWNVSYSVIYNLKKWMDSDIIVAYTRHMDILANDMKASVEWVERLGYSS